MKFGGSGQRFWPEENELDLSHYFFPFQYFNFAMDRRFRSDGFAWLEVLLSMAIIALLLQIYPSLLEKTVEYAKEVSLSVVTFVGSVINPRNWGRITWVTLNILSVVFLIGVRQGIRIRYLPKYVIRWVTQLFPASSKIAKMSSDERKIEERKKRDAEWAERAKNRLPHS